MWLQSNRATNARTTETVYKVEVLDFLGLQLQQKKNLAHSFLDFLCLHLWCCFYCLLYVSVMFSPV